MYEQSIWFISSPSERQLWVLIRGRKGEKWNFGLVMVYEPLSSYITTDHSLLISSLEFSHLAWDHWFTLRILKSDKLILKGKYSWWRWIWVYLLNGPLMAVKKTISNLWVWTWHYRVYNFVMVIYLFLWWYHLEFNFLNLFSLGVK